MRTSLARKFRLVAPAILSIACCVPIGYGHAQTVPGCGRLENAYGPFDYRDTTRRKELTLVENFHFLPEIEALRSHNAIGDLDYTLRAFPNHHRALNSVARYAEAGGRSWPNSTVRSAECYFRRAAAFQAGDGLVPMLYGNFLVKTGRRNEAKEAYEKALSISPSHPEVNYNAGLFYVASGDLDRAKTCAAIAEKGGYPLRGLQKKIKAAESK